VTTRRSLLTATLAGAAVTALPGAAGAAAAGSSRITLPPPTGPHLVGVKTRHLVHRARQRELMVSTWYPATHDARRYPLAPFMPVAPWQALIDGAGFSTNAAPPLTAGHAGAPVRSGRHPVIVYSHGNDTTRAETTIVVQELASHGYVVVTVDHTNDGYTEFPGGRLALPTEDSFTPWDSAEDIRLVLDRLGLEDVGMFGWSKGGTSTAVLMNTDRRVRCGLAFDAPMESQPRPARIDRPFMMMTAEFSRAAEPAPQEFWELLGGWRLNVEATGAAHSSYCDHQWIIPQLAKLSGTSDEDLASWIGTLDPRRAVRIQQAYPLAFFDLHLRKRRQRLLEGPSAAFPEVRFLP
jgi:pimeloyl-ACP methyl ester carboxylesterase